jgi:hypothetical protein
MMTVPVRSVLDRDDACLADDRRAVLREIVNDALGPLAGRAFCDVDDLAPIFPSLGRSSRYELARRLPGVQVGRRRLVSVVGIAALALGCEEGASP